MTTINRENFLKMLESVQPGLSKQAVLEQSNAIIFTGGDIATFNDEIACRVKGPLNGEFSGACPAEKLLEQLRKWQEDEIAIETSDSELRIKGKGRSAGFRLENEIILPVDQVEKPKKWAKLHENFAEAVGVVSQCGGRDESRFLSVCLHIHPEWIEAADDHQCCRWTLPTGVSTAMLVRQSSVRHITQLGMDKFAETPNWLHFRNSGGLTLSCRRFLDVGDFPSDELDKILKVEGVKVQLPPKLAEAAEKAAIASSDNVASDNKVLIELLPGKLRIKGQGMTSWYKESRKIGYDSKPMSFLISPTLLIELMRNHNDYVLCKDKLKVKISENCTYVTALSKPTKGES